MVSIILPNYNHSNFLEKRLDSIFDQTYENYEVIILDDASTDNSLELLSKYRNHPKVSHFVVNEVNSGSPFLQWNRGIELAQGDFIWIAESDDYADLRFLEILLPKFDDEISVVYSQSNRVMADGRGNGDWLKHTREFEPNIFENDFSIDGNLFIEKYLIHKNVIPNVSAVLWKSNNLKSLTPLDFPSYMRLNADWYFYLQILCNAKLYFHADSLNFFRFHEQSLIHKAVIENSEIKIENSVFRVRRTFIDYLSNANVINLNRINRESKKSDFYDYTRIVNFHLNRNRYLSLFFYLLKNSRATVVLKNNITQKLKAAFGI